MPGGQILVANIGSTSFKFRLFQMPDENVLARGGVERIGMDGASPYKLEIGDNAPLTGEEHFADYAAAIAFVERKLSDAGLGTMGECAAIGFKPVFARDVSGTQFMDDSVLAAMEAYTPLSPAHNPPYIGAVRAFNQLYPKLPCVGTFETAFYDHFPPSRYRLPVPLEWESRYGIRRQGFHGASHRFITERVAELRGTKNAKLVSCHLGGSSSMAAVKDGLTIDSSWGVTPQSGLPHNNRTGDLDPFAVLYMAQELGVEEARRVLARESGLKGMAGTETGDIRDLKTAAESGDDNARVALEVFVNSIRGYLGRFAAMMNGLDVLVFTAGIGENNPDLRSSICQNFDYLGLRLDEARNAEVCGQEALISTADSRVEVRVIPTNEELIIARNAWELLSRDGLV